MGGTFDPIHHGHLVAASEVAERFALDQVVFVPTGQPWQKGARTVSPAEDRYLMTVIATAFDPLLTVSRVDIDREGETYTVDTLADLKAARGPGAEFFFIMGADALASIKSWHNTENLFSMAHFVGCTRPGHPIDKADLPEEGDFTLIELHVNARGVGEAKTSLTAKVVVDAAAKTLALDNYAASPVLLQNVKPYTPKSTE